MPFSNHIEIIMLWKFGEKKYSTFMTNSVSLLINRKLNWNEDIEFQINDSCLFQMWIWYREMEYVTLLMFKYLHILYNIKTPNFHSRMAIVCNWCYYVVKCPPIF